ncbi:UbiA prenyltransferase family protein [Micromonospora sagamiensis]|uniref:4-hydroxybenzoate polyprenyltransferase n=1 Tax=Micromonospora sagamiensis TaxID=47875 RepID=A0A562WGP0_9ACTN|nr:UbiA prenyltransferase family protein [Micromonospora sagamiensis]TWJ28734.1 4-hydroxybenzoate polyprenyltransferase [Micromonospora sagamiensis]BCL12359.1 decaprenyl-phosphate phosphoribosyltransferase [Micromonospora sagamiensis]
MNTVVRADPAVRTGGPPATRARRVGATLGALVQLARPGHWPKNVLVVSVPLLDPQSWNRTASADLGGAVVAFTLTSALVYVLNDLVDRRRDARNPDRWHRPLASGRVSPRAAVLFAAALALPLAGVLALQTPATAWPVAAYLLLNVAYSAGLKHVPLLDVFLVATGFVLRLVYGYLATGAAIPGWLVTAVFTLCLLLALGKRRQELRSTGGGHRPALRGYTVALTEQLMQLSATLTAGSYLLYLREEAPLGVHASVAAVLLTPMAVFGLFRYLQLVLVHDAGMRPVRILVRDPALVANTVLWAALSGGLLLAARVQS